MDKIKKIFTYIKNGAILRDQDGLNAKVEKEADELVDEIKDEDKDEAVELLLNKICEVFRKGPLAFKPNIEKSNSATFEKSDSGFDARAGGQAKFSLGETDLAKAEYKASLYAQSSISCEKGKEEVSETENSYTYTSGTSRYAAQGELKGESHGHTEAGLLKYKAKAEYDAALHLQGDAKLSATKMEGSYNTSNGIEGKIKVAEAHVEAKAEVKGHVKAEVGIMSKKITAQGEMQAQAKGKAHFVGLEANGTIRKKGVDGNLKVLHGEAEGSTSFTAKGSVGKSNLELQAKANAEAKIKVIEGKVCLALKKDENGRIHIPGADFTLGQASAKAEADFELSSNRFKNKKGKVSAEAKFEGIHARALGFDAKLHEKKSDVEAKAALDVKGVDVNVLNAKLRGRKEGTDIEATAKVRGAEVNVGNASLTGIDDTKVARTSFKTGTALNVGNIQATGIGKKGVNVEADMTAGLNVGNVSIGISRETGVSATTQISFGNVNLTIGPPKLNFGLGFNFGIPFFSSSGIGGSSSSGGGGGKGIGSTTKQMRGAATDGNGNCDSGTSVGKDEIHGQTFNSENNLQHNRRNRHQSSHHRSTSDSVKNYENVKNNGIRHDSTNNRMSRGDGSNGDSSHNNVFGSVLENVTIGQDRTLIPSEDNVVIVLEDGSMDGVHQIVNHFGVARSDDILNQTVGYHEDQSSSEQVSSSFKEGQSVSQRQGNVKLSRSSRTSAETSTCSATEDISNSFGGNSLVSGKNFDQETPKEASCGNVFKEKTPLPLQIGNAESGRHLSHQSLHTMSRESSRKCGTYNDKNNPYSLKGFLPDIHERSESGYIPGVKKTFHGGQFASEKYSSESTSHMERENSRNFDENKLVTKRNKLRNQENKEVEHGQSKMKPSGRGNHTGTQRRPPRDTETPDLRSTSAYNKRLKSLVETKVTKESNLSSIDVDRNPTETDSSHLYWTNKEQVKRDLLQKHKSVARGKPSGNGKKDSGSQMTEGSVDSFEDGENTIPQKKAPPKKPFGEKKNIHTIFTLNGGDSRPVKYIKDNVACFGDD